MRVIYKDFYEAFISDGDYSKYEIKYLFDALKSADKQTRKWFINWFQTGIFPDDEIEGVTAEFLINELKCKPLNAFIILDWLKAEPETAKFFIMKLPLIFNIFNINAEQTPPQLYFDDNKLEDNDNKDNENENKYITNE